MKGFAIGIAVVAWASTAALSYAIQKTPAPSPKAGDIPVASHVDGATRRSATVPAKRVSAPARVKAAAHLLRE